MAEEDIDLGAYLDSQRVTTESELPEVKPKKLTFYYPNTPEATRAAGLSYSMEGGIHGGPGFSDLDLRNHTLEKFHAGESPFVAVAMPGRPTGEEFRMTVGGKPIIAKNVDTGGGLHGSHIDIATSNPDLARGGGTGGGTGMRGSAGVEAAAGRQVQPIELPDIFAKHEEKRKPRAARAAIAPSPPPKIEVNLPQVPQVPVGGPNPAIAGIGQPIPTPDAFSQATQEAVTNPPAASLVAGPPTAAAAQQAQDIDLGAYLASQNVALPTATPQAIPTATPDIDLGEYLAQNTSSKEIPQPLPGAPGGTPHPFLQGAVKGIKRLVPPIPKSVGEGARMAAEVSPVGAALTSISQVRTTVDQLSNLEKVKQQYGGGSPEYQEAAGEVAGTIIPQMIMAAGGIKALKMARGPSEITRYSGEVIPESAESAAAAQAAKGKRLSGIAKAFRSLRDTFTIEPLPNLRRAGIRDSGYAHASSRTAIGPMAKDLVSRVFPDQYKNPEAMKATGDILVKDNVLGIYDQIRGMLQRTDLSKQLRERLQLNLTELETSVPLADYDAQVRAAMNDPVISQNMALWKQEVNPEMDAMYTELHGEDPNFQPDPRGRHFGARVNLLPDWDAKRLVDFQDHTKAMPEPSYSNYRNPNVKRDPFARHAAGTGKYVTDPEAMLVNTLSQRWVEVTKLRFYRDIVSSGNGIIVELGASAPPKTAGMVRMPITMPETGPNGNMRMVDRNLYVKREIADETRQVLNVDKLGMGHPLFQWVTSLQLLQAVDMVAHMKNIHTVIANSLTGSFAGLEALRRFPGISSADTVARMASVIREIQKDTPAIRREIADMAKRGEVRPRYPSTGIQKITKGQDMIHEADTAARVIMKRFWEKNVQKNRVVDTSDARRQFVNKIGEYNQRVMNDMMRRVRALGLSPFVVAGRSFNAYSRRLIFGSPGFKPANLGQAMLLRGLNVSSLAITASIVAGLNYAITGKPGGRDGVPLGAVDTGNDDAKGKPVVVDVFHVLGIRRGLRATGIGSVVEGVRQGQSAEKISENAIGDVVSSSVFPWMGPGIQAVIGATTGKRLDFRSGGDVYQVGKKLKDGEGIQYIENLRGTLKETNPLLYSLIAPVFHEAGYEEPKWQQPSPLWGSETAGGIAAGFTRGPLGAVGIRPLSKKEMGEENKRSPKGFYLGR